MEFIETSIFTAQVATLLSDDGYQALQNILIENPRAGAVIPGTGGVRKLRVRLGERGKRGGARLIYFVLQEDRIGLLFLYAKVTQSDLSPKQKKLLAMVVKQWQ